MGNEEHSGGKMFFINIFHSDRSDVLHFSVLCNEHHSAKELVQQKIKPAMEYIVEMIKSTFPI